MKKHLATFLLILLSCITIASIAQNNQSSKAPLFKTMPKTIHCSSTDLDKFFKIPKGQQKVKESISGELDITGDVISNVAKLSNLFSMTVKLPGYNDAIFSISKRIDEKNNPVFTGHIFQQNSSDGYELKKNEADGTYEFIKIDIDDILPTCAQS